MNQSPKIHAIQAALPSPKLSTIERAGFILATAITATGFLHAAFFAYAASMRISASIGWFVAWLVTTMLWSMYISARKLYVDNMVAAHILKALNVSHRVISEAEAKKLLDKNRRR